MSAGAEHVLVCATTVVGYTGNWPNAVGGPRVTTDGECADCGANDDRFGGFRRNDHRE